jgi:hypothetical protein
MSENQEELSEVECLWGYCLMFIDNDFPELPEGLKLKRKKDRECWQNIAQDISDVLHGDHRSVQQFASNLADGLYLMQQVSLHQNTEKWNNAKVKIRQILSV